MIRLYGLRHARRSALAAVVLLVPLLAADPPGGTPTKRASELASMSLEDLLKVEVSSVSRKDQQLARTPAAVFVISQEDIRRSGSTSLPELLRMVPGVQVARISSNQWAVSARGFNRRMADSMQVMIDGRSVYDNLFSGVLWDQNDLLLADVERIEVIRGPGSTMWGANAVNGVINVITKHARDTQGGLLGVQAGNMDRPVGALRYGGTIKEGLYYRGYAKYSGTGPMQHASGADADDQWHTERGGGRLDWSPDSGNSVTVQGEIYRGGGRQELNPTAPLDTGKYMRTRFELSGGFAMARWSRRMAHSDFVLQTYYNRESRVESYGSVAVDTADFDFQHHIPLGERNDLMWGVGYRFTADHLAPGQSPFSKDYYRDNLFSTFLQDDLTLIRNRLVLTAGTKLQHNSFTGVEVQPAVKLLWTPSGISTFWASASRAIRQPSIQGLDLNLYTSGVPRNGVPVVRLWRGNPDFKSPVAYMYETGYRHQFSPRLAIDAAGFYGTYSRLEALIENTAAITRLPNGSLLVPYMYQNALHGRTGGVETAATWTPAPNWRISASHAWFLGRLNYSNPGMTGMGSERSLHTPRNTVTLRCGWDISRRWSTDASVYHVSALSAPTVNGYVRVDVRLGFRPSEDTEISLGAANLLSPRHAEFVPNDYSGYSQIRRSAYVKFVWRF